MLTAKVIFGLAVFNLILLFSALALNVARVYLG